MLWQILQWGRPLRRMSLSLWKRPRMPTCLSASGGEPKQCAIGKHCKAKRWAHKDFWNILSEHSESGVHAVAGTATPARTSSRTRCTSTCGGWTPSSWQRWWSGWFGRGGGRYTLMLYILEMQRIEDIFGDYPLQRKHHCLQTAG